VLAEFELSMRRSRKRREVLIMLASLTEATPRALAHACGVNEGRLLDLMQGGGQHSVELSLLVLGLAEARLTPRGTRIYMITDRGRRKARQLTAREARKAIARVANMRWEAAQPPPRTASPPAAEPTGVRTGSFSWSVT
jgi:predicted transcriptional regulator with HTH domain